MLRAGNVTYEPTPDDKLWLRRAVEAEGEPYAGVAAALVNGFMFVKSQRHWRGSLADYVRSYSKPVNPAWFAPTDAMPDGGVLFAQEYRMAHPDQRVKMLARAEERRDVHSQRDVFRVATEAAVNHALAHAPQIANATDFASSVTTRDARWLALTIPQAGQNRFWARPGAWRWPGYSVGMLVVGEGNVGVVVAVLLVVFVGLAIARGHR